MKRCISITLSLALLLSFAIAAAGMPAFAQEAAGSSYKIGIIDVQQVMDEYQKQKDHVARLEKAVSTRHEELKAQAAKFQEQKKAYTDTRDSYSEEQRVEKEADLDKELLELESEIRKAEAEFERKRDALKKELLKDIVAAIEKLGQEENYHLILEADPESRTGVLYFATALNMTSKVIDRLNADYKKAQAQ